MRRIAVFAGLLALAGCAYPNPLHVKELNALVGKSEPDLLRSYGVPSRTYDTSGLRFVTYQMNRIESFGGIGDFGPGFGYGGGFGGFGYGGGYGGFGYGGGFGEDIVERDCNTTFELKGGVVKAWSLRGNAC